jgi:(2Fe-2S) ferredoxin
MAKDLSLVQRTAFICNGDSCLKKGSGATTTQLRAAIVAAGAKPHLHTVRTQCTDQCPHGPVVFVHPEGTWYQHVTPDQAATLVTQHLLAGEPVAALVLHQG